jgi:hypothetical protein
MSIKSLLYHSAAVIAVCLSLTILSFAQAPTKPAAPATAAKPEAAKKSATSQKVSKRRTPAAEKVIAPPTLEERLDEQRGAIRRGEAREASSPYLIEEMSVNGIYKSVEGYGAFLKAPNGRTFFAYTGMPFYDGEVLQIEADQVVFQQNLPGGKKKQLVKAYDPSALRSAALEKAEQQKKDKEESRKKKKPKPVEEEEENEDAGTRDE